MFIKKFKRHSNFIFLKDSIVIQSSCKILFINITVIAMAERYTHRTSTVDVAKAIVDSYIHLEPSEKSTDDDSVHAYACELLTLGMIWYNYYDATTEGDGHRIIVIWKFLMLIFRKMERRNYEKEAAHHCQVYCSELSNAIWMFCQYNRQDRMQYAM